MKKRYFFHGLSLAGAFLALFCVMAPGSALAVPAPNPKSVPTCNGWSDGTQQVPAYCATPGPGNVCAGGTTLCTDVFGQANWANSPLPRGPIDISSAIGVTIVDMGSGYNAPVVTVSDSFNISGVTPATCTAVVDNSEVPGAIYNITCTSGGNGYMAPVVTITDSNCGGTGQPACGTGAQAIAQLDNSFAKTGSFQGGIRKFVDTLPDLKKFIPGYGLNPTNPNLYPIDDKSFPGSDYYEIAVVQKPAKMHTDLPPTTFRGYVQVPAGSDSATTCSIAQASSTTYNNLGPIIVALMNRPVRIKFTNCNPIGSAGNLFVPSDTTFMGAGAGPNTPVGTDCTDPANASKCYQENRATLHLHGGNSPWISDGTPHQWTVPYGDTAAEYQKGVSTAYVPDMFFDSTGKMVPVAACSPSVTTNCYPNAVPAGLSSNPGQGAMTFYWTNQQSERLMMYHDHVQGITRINPYIGNAAGYLLLDLAQETALQALNVPGTLTGGDLEHLIPLVIQDKSFVPSTEQLQAQDPTWIWGTGAAQSTYNGNGDLWFSHVYPPNQNPLDSSGSNAFGRWDYGVWFVPGQNTLTAAGPGPLGLNTAVTIPCTSAAFPGILLQPTDANKYQGGCPIIPNPSGTPESINDTPTVNGMAYPVLDVKPEAYRFQILSVSNDRTFNLQLYEADPATATSWSNGKGTDIRMLPAVVPGTGTAMPLCKGINAPVNTGLGIGLVTAFMDATGNPLNGTGLLKNCWPNYGKSLPSSQGVKQLQFMWPADGRDGGVPDPRYAGPAIVQIGTEGGLLPAPVVIPSTPSNYEVNMRSVTVTNISTHGLWLGTAERADAIIDFTKFAGRTLILYNDAPAPAPAFDMRLDYYTGNDDLTAIGGAPTTVLGYGPNTRTLMMIRVGSTPSSPARPLFNVATLAAGQPAIYQAVQPPAIVPQPAYPQGYGSWSPTVQYLTNFQSSDFTFSPPGSSAGSTVVGAVTVTNGGSGYTSSTTVTIDPPSCVPSIVCTTAIATPTIVGGVITDIQVTNVGTGYGATIPNVNIIPNGPGTGASATAVMASRVPLQLKAIQELFTLDYGRMNATLGTEIPFTNFNNQTTLPFGFLDWTTEILQKDAPQLWYLYHNGVDSHWVHFHLFNVQVINRIGWDGSVRAIDPNEIGWKETVRMNPLENIVFAIKPITPDVPFPLPDSIRLQDPTKLAGVVDPDISGIDPATGNVLANGQVNTLVNFGWEYVWHCHILGHEENDMMRPIIYQVPPAIPTNLALNLAGNLTWTDNSASETAFTLQSAASTDPLFITPLTTTTVTGTNSTGFSTLGYGQTITFSGGVNACTPQYYRVQAQDDFADKSPLSPHATQTYQTVAVSSPWTAPVLIGNAALVISIASPLPYGIVGTAYNQTLTATGGTGTYTNWAITAGNLPDNLHLGANTGVISGTPSANGTFNFTVRVTDSCGITATKPLSITIYSHPVISTATPMPNGEVSTAYNQTLAATGGSGSYTNWAITVGSLPGGLGLNAATGAITGTPTIAGIFTFTVQVTDSIGLTATKQLRITINPKVTTTNPLAQGEAGLAYTQALTAIGVTAPYTWSVASGSLPAGLAIVGNAITGTPGTSGTSTFTVRVTDSTTTTATSASLSITIIAGPSVTTTSPMPVGTVGVLYSRTLTATGGTGGFNTWTVSAGSLPAGLTLNPTSGVISGTPPAFVGATVTSNFSITVKDSAGATSAAKPLSITVGNVPTAPPANFRVITTTQTAITLGWNTNTASYVQGFMIERAPNIVIGVIDTPGTFVQVTAAPAATATRYTNSSSVASPIVANTKYWYRIRAYNAYGTSAYATPSIMATTLP